MDQPNQCYVRFDAIEFRVVDLTGAPRGVRGHQLSAPESNLAAVSDRYAGNPVVPEPGEDSQPKRDPRSLSKPLAPASVRRFDDVGGIPWEI